MRHFIFFLLFSLCSTFLLHAQLGGRVFVDTNDNNTFDPGETKIPFAIITNGKEVVKTNPDGNFQLPKNKDTRFVSIAMPNGYTCDRFFYRMSDQPTTFDFPLKELDKSSDTIRFIHITDTESSKNTTNWIEMLQAYIQNEGVDFLIHTGDICYEEGMRFHAENLNTKSMGIPAYYCIGNHDLVKGPYGEALFEELFGPPWYSFEYGNAHFIVTPMLRGDYKPSYTKTAIYEWLKNLLHELDKEKPKFIFNHDLLTGEDEFLYSVKGQEPINLNEHNLKAWVYGHWHGSFYRPHGNSGVVSICTGVAQKGGIDHSLSQFRVFELMPDGNFTTEIVQSFVDHELAILSPAPHTASNNSMLPILVNAYNSTSKTNKIEYQIDSFPKANLEQKTNWAWTAKHQLDELFDKDKNHNIRVSGFFNDDTSRTINATFRLHPSTKSINEEAYWPNFLMNAQHNPDHIDGPTPPLKLEWVTNLGANSYMCSPVIAEGKVFMATYDNGDARNCFLLAFDFQHGQKVWQFQTENSVKGAISYDNGQLFATDMIGNVYAIDASTGKLNWKIRLDMEVLPAYVGGTVATGGLVFTGDGSGFSAITQPDGTLKWKNEAWRGGVGAPPSPTVGEEIVVVSSNWNALYAHDISTGKLLWKNKEKGLRFRDAAPLLSEDKLYVGTQQNLIEINPKTGGIERIKKTKYYFKSNSTPLVYKDLIILGSGSSGLLAFHKNDFSLSWRFKTGAALSTTTPYGEPIQRTIEASPVLVDGKTIFIGASDGVFYAIDLQSGKEQWRMEVGAPILATIAATDNRIFLTDIAGNLYCFTKL